MTHLRALCAVAGLQAVGLAQLVWQQAVTTGPPIRFIGSMAYDAARGCTVLFGGMGVVGGSLGYLPDTWEWDGLGAWQLRSAAPGPSARVGHAMAFDSARGRTVLFGGTLGGGGYGGDTWEWDGNAWVTGPGGAGARTGHAMVFDSARGKTVLFGGSYYNGLVSVYFGDTWEWNGSSWTQVASNGPSARSSHAMAFDSARGKTVLFGGTSGPSNYLGDTWEWSGVSWALSSTPGPSARAGHVMAFDSARAQTVLFGGNSGTDAWAWDGSTWALLAAVGPTSGMANGLAFDSQRGRSVLCVASSPFNTTWELHDPAPGIAVAFGSGCGAPALSLSPDIGALPTIGATAQAFMTNVPSPWAFVALGWSNSSVGPFQLPVPLDGYGMTGCFMRQSTDVIGQPATLTAPTAATYSLSVPFQPSLIGLHIYLQGWAVAPGMNPANIIVSNGLDWLIGY